MRSLFAGALLLSGCAATVAPAEVRDLRKRVEAGEADRVATARKLEELDNRVFLLTDQVESHKVALAQRGGEPKLPVVTLQPPPPPLGVKPATIGPAVDPDAEPEFEPPTTIREGKRPTITLEGSATPWLDQEDGGAAERARASERKARQATLSSAVVPRRSTRTVSPPASEGLGVTKGKPPLVDEVVTGAAAPVRPTTPVAQAPLAPSLSVPPADDPTSLYRAAYERLRAGQGAQAAVDFRAFVRRFPQHDLADNAQYWLGETYYARAEYPAAEPEFRAVIRLWPSGNKAPDALLKLAYCMLAEGKAVDGKATLHQLIEHYPRTEAAALAQKRLGELPTEAKK